MAAIISENRPRMLVAYSASETYVQATLDYLLALKRHLSFRTDYLHVATGSNVDMNFDGYDILFQNYCARLCFPGYVSRDYIEKARKFRGLKILSVQDEYQNTNELKRQIKHIGFDIVLTCVPQDSLEYVYPKHEFPNIKFVTVFTGYVSGDASVSRETRPLADRPIFLGYRGRDIGAMFGRLGFDKMEVGRGMKAACDARGIATDIAWDEESRIYGTGWLDFVGNCRAMLGSESGSNVFDFDGSICARFEAMTAANGVRPSYADFLPYITELDTRISMGQISPRVFECAVMRTPMVLFTGRYSDAIEPSLHYIALEKDFSNVDSVLSQLEDIPQLTAMADRAYAHLVSSGRFGYRSFGARLEALIRERTASRWRFDELPDIANLRQELLPDSATPFPLPADRFHAKNLLKNFGDGQINELDRIARRYIAAIRANAAVLSRQKNVAHVELIRTALERCELLETASIRRRAAIEAIQSRLRMNEALPETSKQLLEEEALWNADFVLFFNHAGTDLFALRAATPRRFRFSNSSLAALRGLPIRVAMAAMLKDIRD